MSSADSASRHIEAMDKIASLIKVRERCVSEVEERLRKSEFSEEEIRDAVQSAQRCGLIDESRYVSAYVRGKVHSGWGRGKIVARLKQKGIDETLIAEADEFFPTPDEDFQRALHELERKSVHSKDPYASLMRRLVGKGYSFEISKRAVSEFLSHNE